MTESEKFVFLALDEMQIHKGLVYDSVDGELVGFTNYGQCYANDKQRLATHMQFQEHFHKY